MISFGCKLQHIRHCYGQSLVNIREVLENDALDPVKFFTESHRKQGDSRDSRHFGLLAAISAAHQVYQDLRDAAIGPEVVTRAMSDSHWARQHGLGLKSTSYATRPRSDIKPFRVLWTLNPSVSICSLTLQNPSRKSSSVIVR